MKKFFSFLRGVFVIHITVNDHSADIYLGWFWLALFGFLLAKSWGWL